MANTAIIKNTKVCVGDTVKVHQKILEKDKERIQIFSGIIIRIKGREENKSFTVRRIATGAIGVERIWPVITPWISKIEVIKSGKVKKAKLYYLRNRAGKQATRIKVKKIIKEDEIINKDGKKVSRKPGRKPGSKVSSK